MGNGPLVDLEPVRRRKIHDTITDQLRKLIREGRLNPGDRLPPERQLAKIFRVSRASVRDALRGLEVMGFIESRQGNGTYVAKVDAESLATPLAVAVTSQIDAPIELMDFRIMLEPAVAALAAEKATEDDIRELRSVVTKQREAFTRDERGVELDAAFHYSVAQVTRNGVVVRVMDLTVSLLRVSLANQMRDEDRAIFSLQGHERILSAIERHDPQAASLEMRSHLEGVRSRMLAFLDETATPGNPRSERPAKRPAKE